MSQRSETQRSGSVRYRRVCAAERPAAIAAARETLARFEPVIAGPYFAGASPGLVDFAAGPALVRFEKLQRVLGPDLDSLYSDLPHVAAWAPEIAARPAFRDTLVADFDERFRALIAA